MQQCPFCKIIQGAIPSKKVFEDDKVLAILDIHPASRGHVLLVPKQHFAMLPMMPQSLQHHMATIAQKISNTIQKKYLATRVTQFIANGAVAGQQSAHFLMHVFPSDHMVQFDVRFPIKRTPLQIQQLEQHTHAKLARLMQQQGQVDNGHIIYSGFTVFIPQQTTHAGHVEITAARDPVNLMNAANQAAGALFELTNAHGSNIIIHQQQKVTATIHARKQSDGINFSWQPIYLSDHEMNGIKNSLAIGLLETGFTPSARSSGIDFISQKTAKML